MKRSLKLFLVLVIGIALLLAAGYYFLIYRSGVSAEFYTSRGDSAMAAGSYSTAIRCYGLAMNAGDTKPETAISLAEAYKSCGNFTKAEYTLVNAITKDPDATELYIALSHTYIEQGKFLDADRMLTNAYNESVKAELEIMRPKPPVLTPESGYYSTRISVSASCPAGRIFVSCDGSYPSNDDDLYKEPIELPVGETTICALVVDDSGLVSPAVYAGYTIGGIIEPVTLSDPALDQTIRELLGKEAEDVLMSNELWSLEELEIKDLENAEELSLLTGLKRLKIAETAVSDFTSLEKLSQLQSLTMDGCILSGSSLAAIGHLPDLNELHLSGCALKNVDALSGLTKLTILDLSDNALESAAVCEHFSALEVLSLHNNPIASIAALKSCTELKELDVSNCQLSSLDVLAEHKKLTSLSAAVNQITSVTALRSCSALETLDLSENQIVDISFLPELKNLKKLEAGHNQISVIPTFDPTAPLQSINLNYNQISRTDGLADLRNLNYVKLDYNQVADLTPMENCPNLVQVDVWENPVSETGVKKLQEHSIIVNYNPQ